MIHDFELHELFNSPKNLHLKALLKQYTILIDEPKNNLNQSYISVDSNVEPNLSQVKSRVDLIL